MWFALNKGSVCICLTRSLRLRFACPASSQHNCIAHFPVGLLLKKKKGTFFKNQKECRIPCDEGFRIWLLAYRMSSQLVSLSFWILQNSVYPEAKVQGPAEMPSREGCWFWSGVKTGERWKFYDPKRRLCSYTASVRCMHHHQPMSKATGLGRLPYHSRT